MNNKYKIWSRVANCLPLSTILLSIIIALFIFVSITVSLVTYNQVCDIILDQQEDYQTNMLKLKTESFETYVKQLETFSMSIRNDEHFLSLLTNDNELSYESSYYILSLLKTAFYSRQDLITVKLYPFNEDKSYRISKNKNNIIYGTDAPDPFILEQTCSLPGYKYIQPGEPYTDELMIINRTIINIRNKQPLAMIEYNIDNSYLNYLSSNEDDPDMILCLLDIENNLYYTSDSTVVNNHSILSFFSSDLPNDGNSIVINDVEYMIASQPSSNNAWRLLSLVSTEKTRQALHKVQSISSIITTFAIVLLIIGIFGPIRHFTYPLKVLASRMDDVGHGDFKTEVSIDGCYEIMCLSSQFNSMTSHINELIETNYKAKLSEKNARLIALEAQINPHFLYNTLQSISTKAVLNGQSEIYEMITALAGNMRYAIKDGEYALVSSEIKHVGEYLMLQKSRFDTRLTYSFHISPETINFLIPKIILQPLVENSIIHGMKHSSTATISINITIFVNRQHLVLSVSDNGCGISPDALSALRQDLLGEDIYCNEIGIRNLAGRLRILYNDRATLFIESEENQGTKVSIHLPLEDVGKENICV